MYLDLNSGVSDIPHVGSLKKWTWQKNGTYVRSCAIESSVCL